MIIMTSRGENDNDDEDDSGRVDDNRDFKIQRRGRRREPQKKTIGFISKKTALHVHHTFFVHFFPVFARL